MAATGPTLPQWGCDLGTAACHPCLRILQLPPTADVRSNPPAVATVSPYSLAVEHVLTRPPGPRVAGRPLLELWGSVPVGWRTGCLTPLAVRFPHFLLHQILWQARDLARQDASLRTCWMLKHRKEKHNRISAPVSVHTLSYQVNCVTSPCPCNIGAKRTEAGMRQEKCSKNAHI